MIVLMLMAVDYDKCWQKIFSGFSSTFPSTLIALTFDVRSSSRTLPQALSVPVPTVPLSVKLSCIWTSVCKNSNCKESSFFKLISTSYLRSH